MHASQNMTLKDLTLRVAERAAKIQQNATTGKVEARTVEPDADSLYRSVIDGAREFEDAHDWAWKECVVEMQLYPDGDGPRNIEGSAYRYLLPQPFSAIPSGDVQWTLDNSDGGDCHIRHHSYVRRQRFLNPTETGPPQIISGHYSPLVGGGKSSGGGIELQVFPKPDDNYTVSFESRLGYSVLTDASDRGYWPACHDQTVVAFAVRCLFVSDRQAGDVAKREAAMEADRLLVQSVARDDSDLRPIETTHDMPTRIVRRRRLALFDNVTGAYVPDGLE